MKKIVFTGGSGRFAKEFKKIKNKFKVYFPDKKKLNIENFNSIKKFLIKTKPNYFIHCAALSRPMSIHEENIAQNIYCNSSSCKQCGIKCCSAAVFFRRVATPLYVFWTIYLFRRPKIRGRMEGR